MTYEPEALDARIIFTVAGRQGVAIRQGSGPGGLVRVLVVDGPTIAYELIEPDDWAELAPAIVAGAERTSSLHVELEEEVNASVAHLVVASGLMGDERLAGEHVDISLAQFVTAICWAQWVTLSATQPTKARLLPFRIAIEDTAQGPMLVCEFMTLPGQAHVLVTLDRNGDGTWQAAGNGTAKRIRRPRLDTRPGEDQ